MKPSILLVDDVEANLIALEASLGGIDCEPIRAASGNEALRQLLKREFAAILLDVQMPGMDGYEVASLARQNPRTRDIPIIFLTATHHTEDSVLKGYGSGAIDFLLKPINTSVLRAKVTAFLQLYLSRKRLEGEIEAHKKTMASLELANDALRHFTGAASHDLRAPLRTICSFISAVIEDAGPTLDAQSRDFLERSHKAGLRMGALLDSLLSYAQLRGPTRRTEVSCDAVVGQVRSDLTAALEKSGGAIHADPLPTISGDPGRIYQLFLNLASNALKFARPGVPPKVHISATRRGDEWLLCFTDDGIGMEPAQCTRIFQAFSRLHAQDKYEGSGLGLAICQQIVEQHGGRIWAESQPDRGSTFFIALPTVLSTEPPRAA